MSDDRLCADCLHCDLDISAEPCKTCNGFMTGLHTLWESNRGCDTIPLITDYVTRPSPFNEAVKNDEGKARFDLIPAEELYELAELYAIGAKKYGDRNWEKGLSWSRVFSAMMRHAWKWWMGEEFDKEDGQHHLTSVMWCAIALRFYQRRGLKPDEDG